jgi:hypothetical protein
VFSGEATNTNFVVFDLTREEFRQVRPKSKDWKAKLFFFLSLERLKIKGPTRRAKTDKGHLCLRELKLSFDDDYIGWRNSKCFCELDEKFCKI